MSPDRFLHSPPIHPLSQPHRAPHHLAHASLSQNRYSSGSFRHFQYFSWSAFPNSRGPPFTATPAAVLSLLCYTNQARTQIAHWRRTGRSLWPYFYPQMRDKIVAPMSVRLFDGPALRQSACSRRKAFSWMIIHSLCRTCTALFLTERNIEPCNIELSSAPNQSQCMRFMPDFTTSRVRPFGGLLQRFVRCLRACLATPVTRDLTSLFCHFLDYGFMPNSQETILVFFQNALYSP